MDESRRGADVKLDGGSRGEMWRRGWWGGGVRRWACWGKVRGSNHRVSGEEEGANKQQSRRKSDKDGIDSRTTGRAECDKEENDVRDKAEWHKCHHANLSCTLPLSPLYFASVPPLLPDPKPGGDAHQMGSMEAGSRPPATNFPHLTASTVSRHQREPSQPGLRLHSWGQDRPERDAGSRPHRNITGRGDRRRTRHDSPQPKQPVERTAELVGLHQKWNRL